MSNPNESKTQETDANSFHFLRWLVSREYARKLQLERDEARQERDELKRQLEDVRAIAECYHQSNNLHKGLLANIEEERDQLRAALKTHRQALEHVVDESWFEHDPDCAQDDTCTCTGVNLINKAHKEYTAIQNEN